MSRVTPPNPRRTREAQPDLAAEGPARSVRARSRWWACALMLLGAACSRGTGSAPPSETTRPAASPLGAGGDTSAGRCGGCASPTRWGTLANPALREVSGIVGSAVHPDVFYVHNDSGDGPRLYALDRSGADQGTFELAGATAVDWEEVARGPCPAGSCLFVADLGDNDVRRGSYTIYLAQEPATLGAGAHTLAAEALPIAYPDGPHDAECLLVHPRTGVLTVVTKAVDKGLPASVYQVPLPLTPGRTATLRKLRDITLPVAHSRVTGGSVRPSATAVLLRTHTNVLVYPMTSGQSVADALAGTPCVLPADAKKGEAVSWVASGEGFVTVDEGRGATLDYVACAP